MGVTIRACTGPQPSPATATPLLAVVAAIIALLGGRDASSGPIARRLRNAALALLRPAESAARRLIVIAARGVNVAQPRPPISASAFGQRPASGAVRPRAFRLFDRRKRFVPPRFVVQPLGIPRIRSFWAAPSPLTIPIQNPVPPGEPTLTAP